MSDGISDAFKRVNLLSSSYSCNKCAICSECLARQEYYDKDTDTDITFQDDISHMILNPSIEDLKEGTKFDKDKIPVELLPTQALEEIAKVLQFGAKKYDKWNWAKGFKWTRLIGAAIRHLYAYQRGEDKDPESGLSHLAHSACCILFLLQYAISGLGEDDRYKGFNDLYKGDK